MNKQCLFHLLDDSFAASRIREVVKMCRDYDWPLSEEEEKAINDYADRMDAKCIIKDRERGRLTSLYPLFTFTFSDKAGEPNRVKMARSAWSFWKDGHETEAYLNSSHRQEAMEAKLSSQYPNLIFLLHFGRTEVSLSCWCKGQEPSGITGSAIKEEFDLLQPDLHQRLSYFDEQAALSRTDAYFYCSGHDRAEPKAEYSYYYFAGRYCKEYAEQHPEHKAAAARETYE